MSGPSIPGGTQEPGQSPGWISEAASCSWGSGLGAQRGNKASGLLCCRNGRGVSFPGCWCVRREMAAGPGRAASYVQFTTEKEDKGWTGGPARVWGLKLPLGTPSRASPRPQKSGPTKAP